MPRDILVVMMEGEGAIGILWVEARDVAQHPTS